MAWHERPAGASAFPNGSAAQWASEWFTPITAAKLNYLKDNLEFLRNPPRSFGETTPGTTFTSPGTVFWASGTSVLSDTLTNYAGGKLYFFLRAEMSVPTAGGGSGSLMFRFDGPGGAVTRYVDRQGVLVSSANGTGVIVQANQLASAVYRATSVMFIIDASVLTPGNVTWEIRMTGISGAAVKNVRTYLREL